ncbi:MAG TPA: TetR family transcriptional regulator [Gammaproteobacteria bacterium]|nr:TetR family transcriptional regulator [Gammaproteobacteria bacterium]
MATSASIKPRNAAATRLAILNAARERFVRDGYDQAGLRAIAADAGVDPALICRYFGSKESLFAEVLESTSEDPMEVLAGDRGGFGERVARAMLDPQQHCPARIAFLQLAARSSGSPAASCLVRRHIESQFIVPFSAWLRQERAAEKAWLAACVLIGVGVMTGIEQGPRSRAETEAAIGRLARLLQSVIES